MSKKYIIEIEEEPVTKNGVKLWKACGFNALVFDQNGLDKLTPIEQCTSEYNCDLDDAWEVAKKLMLEKIRRVINEQM